MTNTEDFIKTQLKKGNENAYKFLYKEHYTVLCHIACGYVKDDFIAETIVGDVIFHLWEVRESIQIQASLRNYLVKAVRNRCLDYLSSKKEQSEMTFSSFIGENTIAEKYIYSEEYPLGALLEKELEQQIRNAIQRLPEECRKVFLKSRFQNKKYEEIAFELGISVNTVKYHIRNILQKTGFHSTVQLVSEVVEKRLILTKY